MKKSIFIICVLASGCTAMAEQVEKPGPAIETQTLVPLTERVNVQADSACVNQIIDGCWVAVGAKKRMPFNVISTLCSTESLLIVLN